MKDNKINKLLDENIHLQKLLFRRGYLLTTQDLNCNNVFPFYESWSKTKINNYYLYVHKDQNFFITPKKNRLYILIGHAYNPWDSISDESVILEKCADAFNNCEDQFTRELSNVTGAFVIIVLENNKVLAVQDSVGIMPLFYCETNGAAYISSHSQLIADICGFKMDPEIEKLINAPFYKIGIRHLPGIKSPFKEIKVLTANTFVTFSPFRINRFYPNNYIEIRKKSKSETLNAICNILKNSIELCSQKWDASISLTGGTDSKMTLAAANGLYDKFKYFSFYSSKAEENDAVAAHKICNSLSIQHTVYPIPTVNEEIKDFFIIKKIIDHNSAYVIKRKDNDIRKIIFLSQNKNIGVEIKSHVSEIGRGFYYKKTGKKSMPQPLKPRHMSNLYKRNMFNRFILRYMDNAFEEFISVTGFGKTLDNKFDESDMFYWEHRMSQWASFVKQDFNISHETTIIYNNRKLLELFLDFDLNERIHDIPQKDIIEKLNKDLFDLNISNDNAMKNKNRILIERIFFEVNSMLP